MRAIRMLEDFPMSLDGHSVTVLVAGQEYAVPREVPAWHAGVAVESGKAVDADAPSVSAPVAAPLPPVVVAAVAGDEEADDSPDGENVGEEEEEVEAPAAPRRGRRPRAR